jgi:hypothetical protein
LGIAKRYICKRSEEIESEGREKGMEDGEEINIPIAVPKGTRLL